LGGRVGENSGVLRTDGVGGQSSNVIPNNEGDIDGCDINRSQLEGGEGGKKGSELKKLGQNQEDPKIRQREE